MHWAGLWEPGFIFSCFHGNRRWGGARSSWKGAGGPPGIPRPVQCFGPRRVLRGQVLTSDPTPSPRPRLVQGQGGLSLGVQGPPAGGGAVSPQMRMGGCGCAHHSAALGNGGIPVDPGFWAAGQPPWKDPFSPPENTCSPAGGLQSSRGSTDGGPHPSVHPRTIFLLERGRAPPGAWCWVPPLPLALEADTELLAWAPTPNHYFIIYFLLRGTHPMVLRSNDWQCSGDHNRRCQDCSAGI